jgi:hypothetical protein
MRKVLSCLSLLLFLFAGQSYALVDDVNSTDIITVSSSVVKEGFSANTWYTVYNEGRKAYLYGDAKVTSTAPQDGSSVEKMAAYLFRFIPSETDGKYYIQNAEGNYLKELTYNTCQGVAATTAGAGLFTIEEVTDSPGNFGIKGATYYLDSNGSTALGYSTEAPTTSGLNKDWSFRTVTLTSLEDLSGGPLVLYQLQQGGLFRIHSRNKTGQYIYENATSHAAGTQSLISAAATRMQQMWIIEYEGSSFSLRNAMTGKYLQSDYTCADSKAYWTIALSPNNTSTADKHIVICHGDLESKEKNCINLNGGNSGLTDWYYDNDKNSEWDIVAVEETEVTAADVKANIDSVYESQTIDTDACSYYQFINLNTGEYMTERLSDAMVITQSISDVKWNQYWKVTKNEDGTYCIQNIYSSKSINRKATDETSACGGNYVTTAATATSHNWTLAPGTYDWQTTFSFIEPNKPTTGLSVNSKGLSENASIDLPAAQWIVKRADLTEAQVQEAEEAYDDNQSLLKTSVATLNIRLQKFFADYACTTLRDTYQTLTDDSLNTVMSDAGLPKSIIRMALKVKNNTWGHREKEFRIYDYEPYSDPTKWNSTAYMGTGYQFSPQTGPTGISVKAGDIVVFYVGANAAANTTLQYSSVKGCAVYADRTALKRGINIFTPNDEGFIFIHHTITSTSKKLADVDPITIHIEGGRVQGYFDITRGHTNADWKDMVDSLFQDEIVHLKSKYYEYNMHYDQLLKQIPDEQLDEIDTDGTAKAIEGTLHRWDGIVENQRKIMGAEQFADRFNCMLSASSSSDGNPYASSYGTYYPGVGTIMNYDALTHGTENDNGGNFWCIAHETGHIHQGLYNMAGCTEISNNNFSQINTWLQGSNTGRGGAWSQAQSSFHEKVFWQEYNLWQRSRAYFQLWLYFHLMEHDTTFYPRLFDKFRETPMTRSGNASNPGSGTTDYLRFAKFACDVAQADLSEFFQFWGFFIPLENYTVGDYSNSYFTTTQAEIDQALAYMHKYTKKLGNILFIDERIEKYPADYPGMEEGTMRVATTPGVTPGNTSVVGETGMFTQFVDNPETKQYSCVYSPTTGKTVVSKSSGKGAVGFKVYNSNNEFVYAFNTHTFVIPTELRSQPFYIMAALGDGNDMLIYDPKDICSVNDATQAEGDTAFDKNQPFCDLNGRFVTTPQPGGIYIQNGKKYRLK